MFNQVKNEILQKKFKKVVISRSVLHSSKRRCKLVVFQQLHCHLLRLQHWSVLISLQVFPLLSHTKNKIFVGLPQPKPKMLHSDVARNNLHPT